MDCELQEKFILNLQIDQVSFGQAGQFMQQSPLNVLLSKSDFNSLDGIYIKIKANEEVDDNLFSKVITLFDRQQMISKSLKQIWLRSEKGNYITPKTYKTILNAITQHAWQLDLYIEEQVDLNILVWLECFKDIVGVHNYTKLHLELKGVFLLDLNNKALQIEIKDSLQLSEVGLQYISMIIFHLPFTTISFTIGRDNKIAQGLGYFVPIIFRNQEITHIVLQIGQSCALDPDSLLEFLGSMRGLNLMSLKLKIGGSNTLKSSILVGLLEIVNDTKLKVLKLDIGNQTKIFQQAVVLPYLQVNLLEVLQIQIGRMNNFGRSGAQFLSKLVDSVNLRTLNIRIAEFNELTPIQSLHILVTLSDLQKLQKIQFQFGSNIFMNQDCIDQIAQIIQQNANLQKFTFELGNQQVQLNFGNMLTQLSHKPKLISIELTFGGSLIVPSLKQFGQELAQSNHLTVLRLNFKGNNNIDYQDLSLFLHKVKQCEQLNILTVKNGQQYQREKAEQELQQNMALLEYSLISGRQLMVDYEYLNDVVHYVYNYASLYCNCTLTNNFHKTIKQIPAPINNYKLSISNPDAIDGQILKAVCTKIKDQQFIDIVMPDFHLTKCDDKVVLKIKDYKQLCPLITVTKLPIQYLKITDIQYPGHFLKRLPDLLKRGIIYDQFEYQFGNDLCIFSNSIMRINIDITARNDGCQFIYTSLNEMRNYSITYLDIQIKFQNANQDWNNFGKALQSWENLQGMSCKLLNCDAQRTQIQKYYEYAFNWLMILQSNPRLVRVDQYKQNMRLLFPPQLLELFQQRIVQIVPNQQQPQQQQQQQQQDDEDDDQQPQVQILNPQELQELNKQKENLQKVLNNAVQYFKEAELAQLRKLKILYSCAMINVRYENKPYKRQMYNDIAQMLI